MKIAAVDIGTNSVRMLLAEWQGGLLVGRQKKLMTTRLGKGQDSEKRLGAEAVEKTLDALEQFKAEWTKKGYTLAGVIATSAVRDALNPEDLCVPAMEKLGIDIQVISGDLEAKLGYIGAVKGFAIEDGNLEKLIIVDIGGGSTELIVGMGQKLTDGVSFQMGAVRMTETYHSDIEPHHLQIEPLRMKIRTILDANDLENLYLGSCNFIGIGGSITTIAAMEHELILYDSDKVHGYALSRERVSSLVENLQKLTLEEKKHLKGLNPQRADIILSGAIILEEIMAWFKMDHINVSEYDNLEGVLYAFIDKKALSSNCS